jgi:hypothetical protein
MPAADAPPPDPSAAADPEAPSGEAGREPSGEDVKARFRDALERKKGRHTDGVGGTGPNSGRISDVHSRAGGKRQFRRKSG